MSRHSKAAKLKKAEYSRALDELGIVRASLEDAYARFDALTDSRAMDACIFEINALRSKYDCAVRDIKTLFL